MKQQPEWWEESVGLVPHAVTVYENPDPRKKRMLYLRWRWEHGRPLGNWKKISLRMTLRNAKGKILPDVQRFALNKAEEQYEIISGKRAPEAPAARPLTIAEAWNEISHPMTGLYPIPTRYSVQVSRQLSHAARIWGAETPWNVIDRARIRMLGRTRVDEIRKQEGVRGYRGAVETVRRVLTVAQWLRDEEKIAIDACTIPRKWEDELREYWRQVVGHTGESHKPVHLRHTVEEMRRMHKKAHEVDPRFGLLMALGAELRLGQVSRCRRSDISAEHKTLTVHGAGNKQGEIVHLTKGQWAAWERAIAGDGYLHACEKTLPDYPLFPQGRLIKGAAVPEKHGKRLPIERTALRLWWRECEEKAEVPHVDGRGAYGVRRVVVDAAKQRKISREGLSKLGGWSTTEVADGIYADQEAEYARVEAAQVRADIRGEEDGG